MNKIYLFLLAAFVSLNLSSQYANNWKLGNGFGLSFNTSTPTIISSSIPSNHSDNSSTISDASGNLLFYTTGYTVWDKNNNIMPNGSGLIGDYTAGQCALIVPIPCNPNKYVIFQTTMFSNPGWLTYSVVDMNLNSGLGDVVVGQKNISLGSGWTEKICAYYSAPANCYWVLSHKWNSDQFVAFKVDASSIATTSVVSSIGSVHSCGCVSCAHDAMGQLTISPDGSKVVNALTCQDIFEFFDFNITTGVVSNSISIPGNGGNAWGTAFSPDSKKVYVNSIFGSSVFQYDVSTFNSSAILSSLTNVYNTGSGGYEFGYMELGPNGKIYIPQPNTYFFSEINSPNSIGAACNFTYNAISTGIKMAQWGTSRIAYNIPASYSVAPFSLTSTSAGATCNGMSNGSATITPSTSGSFSYLWSPGSYTSAITNSLAAGNYTVTVNSSSCSTTSTVISITQPQPLNVSIDPLQICSGSSGPLNATAVGGTPAYTYSWNTGATSSNISVSPPFNMNYTLYVTDANGCLGTAITTVTVSSCTGIQQYGIENNISVYPNPFSETIFIQSSSPIDELVITNVLGEVVKRSKFTNGNFNGHDLNNGIYFIQIFYKNNLIGVKRIIKSN